MTSTYSIRTFKELKRYIAADLYRYMTSCSFRSFIRGWYITGFRYTFFMRCCKYFASANVILRPLYIFSRIALRHYSIKYGFQIPWQANIGPGLCIGHYGEIIVNPNSTIGTNCNITVGVLLGLNQKKDAQNQFAGFAYPVVGDRVALGNSAKLIGGVCVGSDSIIGVGAIVTKDIPAGSVVVGNPAKIIANTGSASLVGSFHPWTLS